MKKRVFGRLDGRAVEEIVLESPDAAVAVLSISLLRAFGKATILENNIVQTAGSAGESVAAGAIFTLPALIFMGFPFEYVGRDASASPATGSHHVHEREQKLLVDGAFATTPPSPIGPGYVGWVEPGANGNGSPERDKPATAKMKPGDTSS